jgi:hypothetical protein
MSTDKTLKPIPCPFCGAELQHRTFRVAFAFADDVWEHPKDTDCPLSKFHLGDPLSIFDHPSDIEAWNKRTPPAAHPPQRTEQNFCPRCGKRTNDIHTCTPPQRSESSGKPSAWVGMTEQEVWDAVRDTVGIMPSKAFRVYQAIEAKLKENNT